LECHPGQPERRTQLVPCFLDAEQSDRRALPVGEHDVLRFSDVQVGDAKERLPGDGFVGRRNPLAEDLYDEGCEGESTDGGHGLLLIDRVTLPPTRLLSSSRMLPSSNALFSGISLSASLPSRPRVARTASVQVSRR